MTPLLKTADLDNFPDMPPDHRIFYGEHEAQFGDLYLPTDKGKHPVVVFIHGGCWLAAYDLKSVGQACRDLSLEGYAVWNLEYRRIGNGGGWTGTLDDIAAGTDYLRLIADEYQMDLSQVMLMGHSAGGHLCLWGAARHRLPHNSPLFRDNPLPIQGVISLAGIPDLRDSLVRNLCNGTAADLLGGKPDEFPERYAHASPVELLPLNIPQTLIIGAQDEIVHVEHVQAYADVARTKGDRVDLTILPEAGHFELIYAQAAAWQVVKEKLKLTSRP